VCEILDKGFTGVKNKSYPSYPDYLKKAKLCKKGTENYGSSEEDGRVAKGYLPLRPTSAISFWDEVKDGYLMLI